MKRIISILCAAAILLSAVSCDFVSYIPESKETAFRGDLDGIKSAYISNLQSTFEKCAYSDAEMADIRFLLKDAANEINECTSEESIILAYDTHFKRIKNYNEAAYYKSIPSLYRIYLKESVVGSLIWDNYLAEDQVNIKGIIESFTESIDNAVTSEQLDEVFSQLRVALYEVPTKELLSFEVSELKVEYDVILQMFLQECRTEAKREKMAAVIGAYNDAASKVEYDKEALAALFSECQNQIKAISEEVEVNPGCPTELVNALFEELTLAIKSADFLNEAQKEDRLIWANIALSDMMSKNSVSEVRDIYFTYMKSLYKENDLEAYRAVILNELKLYRSEQQYYDGDQGKIDSLKSDFSKAISSADGYSASDEALKNAKYQIDLIRSIADVWQDVLNEFRNKLKENYKDNVMTEPPSMMYAQNYPELADIIDYYAFYQLNTSTPSFACDKFMVELGFSHGTAEETVNIAYWYSELIKPAVGISGYFEGDNYLVIELKPYDMAFYSNRDKYPIAERLESNIDFDSDHSNMTERSDTFNDFPYYKYAKELEGIWNTQQLWYALENEYVPVCIPDSVADKTLNRAKEILREIILEGMTDVEKIFRIYTWIGQNVQYDRQYYYYNTGLTDKHNFPDQKIAEMICFFAEGALLENLSVCYSFAKAYMILLRVEGIEAYYCLGRSGSSTDKDEEISWTHAFVKIKLDGKWYTSDPQRSSLEIKTDGDVELPSYLRLLIPANDLKHIVYTNKDIDMSNVGDYFIYDKLTLNGKKVLVDNMDDIRSLIDELEDGHTVSFIVKKELCSEVERLLDEYPQYRSKRNKTYDYNNTAIAEYYVYE